MKAEEIAHERTLQSIRAAEARASQDTAIGRTAPRPQPDLLADADPIADFRAATRTAVGKARAAADRRKRAETEEQRQREAIIKAHEKLDEQRWVRADNDHLGRVPVDPKPPGWKPGDGPLYPNPPADPPLHPDVQYIWDIARGIFSAISGGAESPKPPPHTGFGKRG